MRSFYLTVLFLTSASLTFGQLESNTLTIQSSRSINVQPDQVVFNVSVTSSLDATLDQVVASLQGSGITAADLTGVFAPPTQAQWFLPTTPGLSWYFTFGVPLAKMKATVASLTTLQASIAKNNSGAALTFSVQGTRVSPELTQAQSCSLKDLIADAQTQAQKLATAAGFIAGPIVAISDGSGNSVGAVYQVQFAKTVAIVDPVSGAPFTGLLQPIFFSTPTPFNCFAEVKFQLLRYQ